MDLVWSKRHRRVEEAQGPSRSPLALSGLVSIIVPCCGQLEFTRFCVPGILRNSPAPFELLFLDVGSVDGTAEYLVGLKAGATVAIEVVRTVTDLDIGAGCEEVLARAKGEYIVLLNNDTLVTDGWIKQLIALINLSPEIGLVGPLSNHASPPQLVEAIRYRISPRQGGRRVPPGIVPEESFDFAPLDAFAREWRDTNQGKWMEVERLDGFCLLVRRQVLTKIGAAESDFGAGLFDTELLCQKARRAGFKLAVCRDLFIHNFASRDFSIVRPPS
jgi:GT2 family glycosyltransferase